MKAKSFSLPNQDGITTKLADFKGKYLVIYFYPKDNTPGCTLESKDFTELLPEFQKLDAEVIGISPDSPKSHCKFIEKQDLKLTLLGDESKTTLEKYGVWKEKSMYGRTYMGVIRTTLLIDKEQNIIKQWDEVKVKNHAQEVLEKLKKINS